MAQNKAADDVAAAAETFAEQSKDLSSQIQEIDCQKMQAAEAVQWPLPGMGFDDTGVTLNGIPLSQLSMSERIQVSVAMGMRLNPDFKFAIVRDGSLLDDEHLLAVAQQVAQMGGQVFIERVGEGTECHIVMQNGRMKDESNGNLGQLEQDGPQDDAAGEVGGV